jgi:hypothetical protein
MVLLSAFDDLVARTLGAFPGPLSKLAYIGNLRGSTGDYHHWGLSRRHGELETGTAIANAHSQVWLEVLRLPLPKLFAELESETEASDLASRIENWRSLECGLTPSDTAGGTQRHFNSILLALSLLSREAKESNRPAS